MKKVDVVGAVIYNEKNEVLCALRSQQMSLPGYWEFPGGKIEDNETPQESLAREIKEELNCSIEVGELVADATHEYPNVIVRLITYKAKIIDGVAVANEHEKLLWLPLNKLKELEWAPADLPTLAVIC
ncbi:(deoxy)nucleoside triphosphate pyrophosphohydrolase [Paenibacillus sp. CGMCC 1.16610]|uniref:8-oxo-dGTP diphosphatase n=1 Tax=Paenibacillus anseongense TaxID=2682845 RepID=A0ABW9TYZ3_9BACL|nr:MULTISPECIES: (deoxy)nucleoside triphosphate pyrophosphohydrolase [Paenibacillus]MBA2943568.1 (deoxy)nucleoside triphosphate pyrophosphohydrolase [Paenibacillus sp. CGMCC 1.16610]MVQ33062.1 NUDIX domain-containing protein [Paenibacillus anseongense]